MTDGVSIIGLKAADVLVIKNTHASDDGLQDKHVAKDTEESSTV